MPDRSKTHHFLPQLILTGFAHDDRVITIDLRSKRSFPQGVDKAGAENDWNTLRLEDGSASDVAEKAISQVVEGPAGTVLKRIRAGQWIEAEKERAALARLMAFQMVRVPGHREQVNAAADLLLKLQIAGGGLGQLREAMAAVTGAEPTDDEVREHWDSLADPTSWSVELPREHHVIESLEHVEGLARVLIGTYSWAVIRWRRRSLLTSDAPPLLVPAPGQPRFYGVGIGTAGSIYFPIGRRCTLVLHNKAVLDVEDGFERDPTTTVARSLNRAAVIFARRWVYHHPHDTLAELLGSDFELPTPQGITYNTGNNAKVLRSLTKAAEWHADHPDEEHPLSRLPAPPDPPPGASPPPVS